MPQIASKLPSEGKNENAKTFSLELRILRLYWFIYYTRIILKTIIIINNIIIYFYFLISRSFLIQKSDCDN